MKELTDNALDAGATVQIGRLSDRDGYYVDDDGPGLDGTPETIASLFSIARPMTSSKQIRLPTRGALGNGLRVVVGSVLASDGWLAVVTRNRRIVLRPETDGTSTVAELTEVDRPLGTRIEIGFGPALPADADALHWAVVARHLGSRGEGYGGKSSPLWYDAVQFHELLLASGSRTVRKFIDQFDSCSTPKSGYIAREAGLTQTTCSAVSRAQATKLLQVAQNQARKVKPESLGFVGDQVFEGHYHAVARGEALIGGSEPKGQIPFVIEVWAKREDRGDNLRLRAMVNRTPVTSTITAYREAGKKLELNGCGFQYEEVAADVPAKGSYGLWLNVTTPYCPITSDGKAPDLSPFAAEIGDALRRAIKKAQISAPKERKVSQKDVVLDNLDEAIAKASGNGEYQFNERQVYYVLREIVAIKSGRELTSKWFSDIITDYEKTNGEIQGMYREPRGSLMHPHTDGEQIALGTLMVRAYERPAWSFNKLLYIEKEGFTQALYAARWPERHDCAIFSSKGFATRAARDLVDKLAEHDEPITVFCVHDADASGTTIYESLQDATDAREARKIQIINLGLEPLEAIDMDLPVEEVEEKDRNKPVAKYVSERWREWLQTKRVELNAMTMPQFLSWLDVKMAEHGDGKLIPPEPVLVEDLEARIEAKVRAAVTERILREARLDEQVAAAVAAIKVPDGSDLKAGVERLFEQRQEAEWRNQIEAVATDLAV